MSYSTFSATNDYSYTFVPSSTVTRRPSFRFTADGTYDFTISNFEIKEVGVSSSGFETAVNEPVVPQVPLMRYNQMATFDGIDDYVELDEEFIFSGEFTVSFWVKHNSSDTEYVLGKPANNFDYFFINPAYARWVINNNTLSSTADITVGVWHHVLGTRDSSNNFTWYLDGVISDLYNGSSYVTTGVTASGNFGIKSFGRSVSNYAQIEINDIAFYNKGFTQAEVHELFNDGVALDATTHSKKDNLLGYWRNDGVSTWKDRKTQQWMMFNGTNTTVAFTTSTPSVNTRTAIAWVYTESSLLMNIFNGGNANRHNSVQNGIPRLFTGSTSWLVGTIDVRGAWTILTYQFQPSCSDMNFKTYVNDTLDINVTNNSNYTNGSLSRLGSNGTSNRFFDGAIAQAGSVASALTQEQITEIFNLGREGNWLTTGHDWEFYYNGSNYATGTDGIEDSSTSTARDATITNGGISGGNDGDVQGSPDSITIREGLNTNRDGLGFYFTSDTKNVLRLWGEHKEKLHIENFGASFERATPITLMAWIKYPQVGGAVPDSKGKIFSDSAYQFSFSSTLFNSGTKIRFLAQLGGVASSEVQYFFDPTSPPSHMQSTKLTDWIHVAFTITGDVAVGGNEVGKIYLNGTLVHTDTSAVLTQYAQIGDIRIGQDRNSSDNHSYHYIDELMVYNKVLSASEVEKNYKYSKGKHKND